MSQCPWREDAENPTRQAIVRAAVELVVEAQSIDAVAVEEIAERAGVSRRSFFNYMPGKLTALLIPLFDLRSHYVQSVLEAPEELDAWGAVESGITTALAGCPDLHIAAQSERILTTLVHASTSTDMPRRDGHEAHSRALRDEISRRLATDDPNAVSLLVSIGDQILRLALRSVLEGGDPHETVAHACHLIHFSVLE